MSLLTTPDRPPPGAHCLGVKSAHVSFAQHCSAVRSLSSLSQAPLRKPLERLLLSPSLMPDKVLITWGTQDQLTTRRCTAYGQAAGAAEGPGTPGRSGGGPQPRGALPQALPWCRGTQAGCQVSLTDTDQGSSSTAATLLSPEPPGPHSHAVLKSQYGNRRPAQPLARLCLPGHKGFTFKS